QDCAKFQRLTDIRFDQPQIVNYSGNRADVNEAVQLLPALSTQPTNPSRGRGDGEWNEQNKSREADCDELALGNVNEHFMNVEELVQPDVSQEVQSAIEKRVKAQHSAELDESRNTKKLSQWRDGQRDQKKTQRPVAGSVSDLLDGIRAQILGIS